MKTEWREPKVLTLYVVDENGKRDRSIPSVIDGTLGDADAVFELLRFHLLRMGAQDASTVVFVADGATWIWRRTDVLRQALGLPRDAFHEMKGASITWTEEHAEGILHLRAPAKSGRWSELESPVLNATGWRPSARNPKRAA